MLTHKGKRVYDGFPTKTNIDAVLEELEKGCALASKEIALQRYWVSKREPKETLIQFGTRLHELIVVAQLGDSNQINCLNLHIWTTIPQYF
jgi:hypothetical protein